MLLLPDEINSLTNSLANLGKFDEELIAETKKALEDQRYDDAVRDAFLVLEARLRLVTGIEREQGTDLANKAFGNNAELPRKLNIDNDPGMTSALRQLYAGAFGVFRNPAAHQLKVDYSANECRAILSLVNLLLGKLNVAHSSEARLKAIYERSKASREVQTWCKKIIDHFRQQEPEPVVNVGLTKIGLHIGGRNFAQIAPHPQRLDFSVFTDGSSIKGVKPERNHPQRGRFSHKRSDKLERTLKILETCRTNLIRALEMGVADEGAPDLDDSQEK